MSLHRWRPGDRRDGPPRRPCDPARHVSRRTLGRDGPPRHRAARVAGRARGGRRGPRACDLGLGRRGARCAHRGPRRARRPRRPEPPRPAAPGAPRPAGPGRPDHAARPQLRLPSARGAARRGVRRRDVLRPVRDEGATAGRRPRLRRHRLPARGCRGAVRRPRAGARTGRRARAATARSAWLRSPCLGLCERAPAAMFTIAGEEPVRETAAPVDAAAVVGRLERAAARASSARGGDLPPTNGSAGPAPIRQAARESVPQAGEAQLQLLRRVGVVDPTSLDAYISQRGYLALHQALAMGPEAVIAEVTDSKLMGRGGAAFPTGRKWAAVASQPAQPHYVVCNADESEPGTFKDRVLMELDPFAVVEAMTIEGFATGSNLGYLYVRGEYPLAEGRIRGAIAAARLAGYLGPNIAGLGLRLRHRGPARRRRLHLRRGDGAVRVDRGQARRAAEQAALPGRGRAVRQADRGQQRRDARQRAGDPRGRPRRRRALRGDRHGGLDRAEAVLPVRQRRQARRLRGAVRDVPPRADRPRRRRAGRSIDPGDPARRRGGRVRRPGRARHAADVRGHAGDRRDARLRRGHGLRRERRHGRHAPADRRVLPRRVVRPVRPVPRRDGAPGGAAGAPRRPRGGPEPRGGAGAARARSARRCATRASAASARRPRRRSSRRSGSPSWWRCERTAARAIPRRPEVAAPGIVYTTPPARATRIPTPPPEAVPDRVSLQIDGVEVAVPAGSTILEACRAQGLDIPTLCYLENLTP